MAIRGYVFDAYGTLFDVHSVVDAGRAITSDPRSSRRRGARSSSNTPGCGR
jgi:FMN phosphatase YigB (HAD superfamily)